MNNQKVNPTRPKTMKVVATPGAAPPALRRPKPMPSMAPTVNPPNTRDYGKPAAPMPGFNMGGAI